MALITTIAELKQFLPIPSTNISARLPAMDTAEERYLLPILGEELFSRLQEAYTAEALTPSLEELLRRSRGIVAPMAYLLNLPYLQANLSDQGVTVLENQNSRKAFRWEYNEVKEGLASAGYAAMETLIIYLREHRAEFPEWESAPYNDPEQTYLIRNGADLKKAIAVEQPHRCFIMVQPMLPMLVRLQVVPVISEEFYEHFNARIIEDNLSPVEKKLAGFLQMALSRLAMAQAGVEMSIKFSGAGFTIVDLLKDQPEEGRTDPGNARLERWRMEMERTGQAYINEAKNYLFKNADDPAFALYKASDVFPKERAGLPDNSRYKGIFRM